MSSAINVTGQPARRRTRRRDALLILLALWAVSIYMLAAAVRGRAGFPLDDSWIHQTYARNLAATGRFEFVPGVPSAASTSPVYSLVLAAGYVLNISPIVWATLTGGLALAAAALLGARMAEQLFPDVRNVGLWTGGAIALAWHHVWAAASSMETMFFCALCLTAVWVSWKEIDAAPHVVRFGRGVALGMLCAVTVATRPEGALLALLIGGCMLVSVPQRSIVGLAAWLGGALLGGLMGLLPYFLLNLSLNNTLLPNTYGAKVARGAILLSRPFGVNLLDLLSPLTAGGQTALLPGVLVAVWWRLRRLPRHELLLWLPLIWSVGLLLLYTLRLPVPYHHGRYVIPALPTFILVGVGGTLMMVVRSYRQFRRQAVLLRVVTRTLALTATGVFLIYFVMGASIFAEDVWRIDSDMVTTSTWIAANLPPDQLLAANDIGAVGYFAPRPILDIAGLISPEVIPIIMDSEAIFRLMQQRGVRWVMLLPVQRDDLLIPTGRAAYWQSRLCERFNPKGGMGGMAVYEFVIDGTCQ